MPNVTAISLANSTQTRIPATPTTKSLRSHVEAGHEPTECMTCRISMTSTKAKARSTKYRGCRSPNFNDSLNSVHLFSPLLVGKLTLVRADMCGSDKCTAVVQEFPVEKITYSLQYQSTSRCPIHSHHRLADSVRVVNAWRMRNWGSDARRSSNRNLGHALNGIASQTLLRGISGGGF